MCNPYCMSPRIGWSDMVIGPFSLLHIPCETSSYLVFSKQTVWTVFKANWKHCVMCVFFFNIFIGCTLFCVFYICLLCLSSNVFLSCGKGTLNMQLLLTTYLDRETCFISLLSPIIYIHMVDIPIHTYTRTF